MVNIIVDKSSKEDRPVSLLVRDVILGLLTILASLTFKDLIVNSISAAYSTLEPGEDVSEKKKRVSKKRLMLMGFMAFFVLLLTLIVAVLWR